MSTKFCNFKMANMINQKNKKNVCFKVLMLPACGAKLEQTQKLLNKEHTRAVSNSCLTVSTCSSIYLQVLNVKWGFPGGSDGKESACSAGDLVRSLEEERATHYSILSWRIPWTEEPGGLQSMGSQRVRHDWVTITHNIKCILPSISLFSSLNYPGWVGWSFWLSLRRNRVCSKCN